MSSYLYRIVVTAACAAAMGLASPDASAGSLTSVGNVYSVGQVTSSASSIRTDQRWNVQGTDEGSSFVDYTGTSLFVFGDSYGYDGNPFNGAGPDSDWRHNLFARSADRDPTNGLDLGFMTFDTANHAKQLINVIPGGSQPDSTEIPTAGVAVGPILYVQHQRIIHFCSPGSPCTCTVQNPCPIANGGWQQSGQATDGWTVNGSGIARSDDNGQTWGAPVNMWSASSNFTQGAFVPPLNGVVYFLGIPAARFGCVEVAKTTSDAIQTPSSYTYWTGSTWSSSESDANCVVPRPGQNPPDTGEVGEFSVTYNTYLQAYLLLYINTLNGNIEARTSTNLTTWSAPVTVQPAYFGGYAPMLIPNLSTGREIYFQQSDAITYSTFLMHATLNTTSANFGPFTVPGHIEAENYSDAFDTTAGNQGDGGWYRAGDVDLYFRATGISSEGLAVAASAGEWLSYSVNVATTGTYKARIKYSSASTYCNVQVDAPGGNPVYMPSTSLPPTGSDTNFALYQPISNDTFTLNAGPQNINLFIPSGSCNISSFDIVPAFSGSEYHLWTLPVEYLHSSGALFLPMSGSGCNVSRATLTAGSGSIANTFDDIIYGYQFQGPISCALPVANGAYRVRFMNAEPTKTAAGQRRFNVNVEGVRWLDDYDTFARSGGQNTAKDEIREIYVQDGTLNVDTLNGAADLANISGLEVVPADSNMLTQPVPGHIEAEDYRPGGQGHGYSDSTSGNTGGYYRGDNVDIRPKAGGGYQVGWTANQEWMMYDLNVAATGTYKMRLRYSQSGGTGCKVKVEGPGGSPVYVPSATLPPTGSFDTFGVWAPDATFTLNKGPVTISLYFLTGGCDIDSLDIYAYNCVSSVCCASSCTNANGDLQCGGTGCSGFPGGADRCCGGVILSHNFSCNGDPLTNAPCVLP